MGRGPVARGCCAFDLVRVEYNYTFIGGLMPPALLKILPFLRNLLPVNKIAAWIVGVALVAIIPILGANKEEVYAEL